MSTMIGIPVIYNETCVRICLEHLKNQNTELFIIDNNSEESIKKLIEPYKKIVNAQNVYVNPAWNQILEEFLKTDHDLLVIMNSDLYLNHDVIKKLSELDLDRDKTIACLNLVDLFYECERQITYVSGGVAGVFIPLTKKMAREVYPIPPELKIWYGDNWIYEKLKKIGYQLTIFNDLQAQHIWSSSVGVLPEAHQVIEQDQLAWPTVQTRI